MLLKSGRYAYKLNPNLSSNSNVSVSKSSKDTKATAPASRLQLEQIITPDPVVIISPPPAPKKLGGSIASAAPGSSKKSGSLHQFYSDDEYDFAERIEETCTDDIQTFTQKATTEKIKVVPVANRLKKANGNALELRRPDKKRDRSDENATAASNKMDVVAEQV